MYSSFNDTLQNIVNQDYDSLLDMAKQSLLEIIPACKTIDPAHDGILVVSAIILSAVSADGKLTEKEKRFVKDLLQFDDDTFDKYAGMYNCEMAELADKFADAMPCDVKASTIALVAAIAACDETISGEESAFIKKLLT